MENIQLTEENLLVELWVEEQDFQSFNEYISELSEKTYEMLSNIVTAET